MDFFFDDVPTPPYEDKEKRRSRKGKRGAVTATATATATTTTPNNHDDNDDDKMREAERIFGSKEDLLLLDDDDDDEVVTPNPPPLPPLSPPPTTTSSVKSSSNSSGTGIGVGIGAGTNAAGSRRKNNNRRVYGVGARSVGNANAAANGSGSGNVSGSGMIRREKVSNIGKSRDKDNHPKSSDQSSTASSEIHHGVVPKGEELFDDYEEENARNAKQEVEVEVEEREKEEEEEKEDDNYLSAHSSLSERCLGRRTSFYLKSEAMVGRITRHRIQTLAAVMGVSSAVHIELSRKRTEEAEERFRIMGEVLEAWCARREKKKKAVAAGGGGDDDDNDDDDVGRGARGSRGGRGGRGGRGARVGRYGRVRHLDRVRDGGGGATVAAVCVALDQARLTYHAGAIRAMTGIEDVAAARSPTRAPVQSRDMPRTQQQRGSPTRRPRGGKIPPPPSSSSTYSMANGYHHPNRYNFSFYREHKSDDAMAAAAASATGSATRRSDGGTEDGSDAGSGSRKGGVHLNDNSNDVVSSGYNSQKTSTGEEQQPAAATSPTKRRRKPKYTFDGKVNRSPVHKKEEEVGIANLRDDAGEAFLIDFDQVEEKPTVGSPKKRREVQSRLPVAARSPTRKKPPPPLSSEVKPDPQARNQRRQRPMDLLLLDDEDEFSSSSRRGSYRERSFSPTKKAAATAAATGRQQQMLRGKKTTPISDHDHDQDNSSSRYSSRDSKDSGFDTSLAKNRPSRGRSRSKPPPQSPEKTNTTNRRQQQEQQQQQRLPQSPTKMNRLRKGRSEMALPRTRSVSPTKSAKDLRDPGGSRLGTGDSGGNISHPAEAIASPTKSRYYFSKYGTWKELQKISQANMKKKPEEPDTLDADVLSAVSKLEYLGEEERSSYSSAISARIRSESYLHSLCAHLPEYLHCAVAVFASFGTGEQVVLGSRTQILVWYTLERLRRFWVASGDPIPEGEDILDHKDTMDFLSAVTRLCYHVSHTEQIVVTSVVEKDRRHNRVYLNFKQYGVRLLRARLENFGIVRFHDRGPFLTEAGHFLEVRFKESLFIDFLGAVHVHVGQEDIRDFSKEKLVACLPFFCGLSSKEESSKGQRMVAKFLDGLSGGLPRHREPDFYLSALQKVWLESQQAWLNGVYEGRLKSIYIYPPPGDRQIILALTTLRLHDLIPLAYYLDNLDPKHVQLEGLTMQECGLDDAGLRMLGKRLFRITRVQITGNYFTPKGILEVTKTLREGRDNLKIRSLDFSDSNINDDCLEKLIPVMPSLEELVLADNFLTWYGIRKMTQPVKKTKRLKRLDLSRCCLNEHAFYELIPLILKTEHVIMEGNQLKIFARQVRDSERLKLDTLVLTNCNLDDACLNEVAKFAYRVPNLNLQGGQFTADGIRQLAKYLRRHDWDRIRSLSLRACKLDPAALAEAGEIVSGLETLDLSYNNLSGGDADVRNFAASLAAPADDKRIRFVDLRHCRLSDPCKRVLSDVGRKEKIEVKMW